MKIISDESNNQTVERSVESAQSEVAQESESGKLKNTLKISQY